MNAKRMTTVFLYFICVFSTIPAFGHSAYDIPMQTGAATIVMLEFAQVPDYRAFVPDFRKDSETWETVMFWNPLVREVIDRWGGSRQYSTGVHVLPWDADAELVAKAEDMSEIALAYFHWKFPGKNMFFYRKQIISLDMELKLLKKEMDPPRIFPLVGPAALHHSEWDCRVKYRETVSVYWPIRWEYRSQEREHEMRLDGDYLRRTEENNSRERSEAQ